MIESTICALLSLHVGLLVIAPRTIWYRWLKQAAFCTGLGVVILSFAARPLRLSIDFRLMLSGLVGAIVGSQVSLIVSLWSCHYSLRRAVCLLPLCYKWLTVRSAAGMQYGLIAWFALYEEVIWRRELQSRLGPPIVAIAITSALFHTSHVLASRKIRLPRLIDILSFSCVLGIVYELTHSLAAAVSAHAVRNLQLCALRYSRDASYRAHIDASAAGS